jgi:asparagine synthase (glutamine-hydrolysing)
MCGIVGFVSRTSNHAASASTATTINRMMETIRHRGPDDRDFYSDSFATLGHLRLSIVDLSTGHQPMFNEDRNLLVVYNGEIYNHASLRPGLEQAGHIYQSHSDTEAILHAYEEFGVDCVNHFRGMFAFAIWDRAKRRLFCARDRLGIKPLYYYYDGQLFAFASEIKALLAHPGISARFETKLLEEYLAFGYTSGEGTLFRGIRKLMPGHHLTLNADGGAPVIGQYWQIPREKNAVERSDAEWIRATRDLLEESVRLRLMADVPLGMFLSGGVDSSAIAALMQRMAPEPVKTFAVGYAEEEFSELSYAREVAARIGTDHREVKIGCSDFFDSLPELVWHEDEPISWPSSVSLFHVSKLASSHVKVVLTGEGSDELFAGYSRYRHQLMSERHMATYRHVPEALRRWLRDTISGTGLLGADLRRKLKHTVLGRSGDLQSLYLENYYGAFSAADVKRLLKEPAGDGAAYEPFMKLFESVPQLPYLERLLYADQQTYLEELLMKQDRMSMAASIESRVPFLDHKLVEFASQIPVSLKLRGAAGKYILKEAVADLLPHDIIHRTKMGFPTPLKRWLLDPQCAPIYDFLLEKDGLLAEVIEQEPLRDLLERHRNKSEDATDRIWNLLNLQLWGDIFLNGKRERWQAGMFSGALAL